MVSSKKLYPKYLNKMDSLNTDKDVKEIYYSLLNGKNSYLRLSRKGSSTFDPTWIDKIEDCLYELGEIITNPREVTKQDSSVTPIELAKKIDGESVQHLASHTQFIKEIDENGNVIPSKILAHFNAEDIHTYENRFIATFIRQLVLFIEKRYSYITTHLELTKEEVMYIKNSSIVNGQEVEIETKIKVKKEDQDKSAVDAKEYIERIKAIREYVSYYYNSPFMRAFKTERNVRRPILQTNIIRKNPKYHKCYETFLFIERFDTLGVSYKIDENYQVFNEEEREDINYLLLSQFLSLQDEDQYESYKRNNRVYKPKILTSIDDEEFIYGDLNKGPIEFVRVDEPYREYIKSKTNNKNIPLHPNKYEREYYEKEIQDVKDARLEEKELDKLIARVQKQRFKYEKEVLYFIDRREYEEAEELRKLLNALLEYELKLIEEKRRLIEEAAKLDRDHRLDQEVEIRERPRESAYDNPIFSRVEDYPQEEDEEEEKQIEKPTIEEIFSDNDLPVTTKDLSKVEILSENTNIPEEEHSLVGVPLNFIKDEKSIEEEHIAIKEEVIYRVNGDSIITYENGHKVETYTTGEEKLVEDAPKEIVEEKKYIVKTISGYYVKDGKYSQDPKDAKVFTNLEKAKLTRKFVGGKVIKV